MAERIAVVGAGVFGLCAALRLRERGHDVTVFDPGPVPHPLAASTDISKVSASRRRPLSCSQRSAANDCSMASAAGRVAVEDSAVAEGEAGAAGAESYTINGGW